MSAAANQVFADYQNAFEDAITHYSPTLFRVACRRLGNVHDAEDAVQDALLSAFKHIGQFEGRSKLSTWLTAIVSNVALMKLRRHSRYETLSLDQDQFNEGAVLANELKDVRANPEKICAQAEMEGKLRRALDQLSPKQRNAIQMCELDGLPLREAANAQGISVNTLKSRVSRARGNLGVLLRDFSGTSQPGKAAPVTDRKRTRHRRRGSSGHFEAAAKSPIAPRTAVSKPSLVSVRGNDEANGHRKLHIEHTRNCYPPHCLENTTQFHPQGYAT